MKVQFSERRVRYRITEAEYQILLDGQELLLDIANVLQARITPVSLIKNEYQMTWIEGVLCLKLSPFIVAEIGCQRDGVVLTGEVTVEIAVDLKA
ncbi:MAG: hypothetical protein OXR68_00355 [Alphaproteobacteria bacterium]|nr:hypothetical protein [Alphaproteobacteria bacterium]MDD9919062.1 hypothetical protein [Alphaproteobacteria bacterium]